MQKALAVALILAIPTLAGAQQWGDLEGTFVYKGTPPAPAKIVPQKDPEFCGKHNLVEEKVVVNSDNKGIANVAIYLSKTPASVHPDYAKDAKAEIVVDNTNCRFTPHVSAIRTGQTLVIGNKDPIGHNTKADFFNNNPFNDLIPAGGSVKKTFAANEATPSALSCNIHPWMTGYVLIRDNPYFAVSDKDGKFAIKNLPAGEHEFIVWHETGYLSSVTLDGKATTWARGRAKVTIKPGANSLGKVEAAPVPR
jgi:hypothetical protein